MKNNLPSDVIQVKDVNLWAHVGVLDQERKLGQEFLLDFSVWLDIDLASKNDDLAYTVDYSQAILEIQKLAFRLNCRTLEYFSKEILDCLESLYGSAPMEVVLRKCFAPVPGFTGTVGLERRRNYPFIN